MREKYPVESETGDSEKEQVENVESSVEESELPYKITPTQYTNKKGKTTDMLLVKFDNELSIDCRSDENPQR
jgi:hypothetical protein